MTFWTALWLVAFGGLVHSAESPPWVERFAFWARSDLQLLEREVAAINDQLASLPFLAGVNSSNRTGFQSAASAEDLDLWVEVELQAASVIDSVVLIPLLAKGARGDVEGLGFPHRFLLEGWDEAENRVILLDETRRDFPSPGLSPVSIPCPQAVKLRKIRLTALKPQKSTGPWVFALSEIMMLRKNSNLANGARVRSSNSREVPPTWSRNNLVDMMTPLGLPVAPSAEAKILGWQGSIAQSMHTTQSVVVDLGRAIALDEIRLIPAWRSAMAWDTYYGFPARFKLETALKPDFSDAVMVHDRTRSSLISPGQNPHCYPAAGRTARFIRMTATRLRDRSGNYVFALGELQAYSAGVNVAKGASVTAEEPAGDAQWTAAGLTDGYCRGGVILELPEWIRQLQRRVELQNLRHALTQRRIEIFSRAEHTLLSTSFFGAGGIVLLAGLFSWRGHRQRVLDRERHRERLARDLHDELGSNLGSIALISSFADQEDAAQLRLDLAEIERVARESADSMRDMVSLLSSKRGGSAADWLHVMSGLAKRLTRGIELECRLPTAPLVWQPNLETRRELYLFCKEVLHNTARHSAATHLKFHLSPTPTGLCFGIEDNGCGFNPAGIQSGHGLGNLRERAAMLHASYTLDSSPGGGTKITLNVPRGRRWTRH
jgi:signal transduction histidine kinase